MHFFIFLIMWCEVQNFNRTQILAKTAVYPQSSVLTQHQSSLHKINFDRNSHKIAKGRLKSNGFTLCSVLSDRLREESKKNLNSIMFFARNKGIPMLSKKY